MKMSWKPTSQANLFQRQKDFDVKYIISTHFELR